jgi:hypothetical protein
MKEQGVVLTNYQITRNEISYYCEKSDKPEYHLKDVNLGMLIAFLTDSKIQQVSNYEIYTDGIDFDFKITFNWLNKPIKITGNMLSRTFTITKE